MTSPQRLESLQQKHTDLEGLISQCEKAPYVDTEKLKELKRDKLKLKEEIEGIADEEELHSA